MSSSPLSLSLWLHGGCFSRGGFPEGDIFAFVPLVSATSEGEEPATLCTDDRSDGGRHQQRITALCRGRKRGGRKMVVMEERRKLVMDSLGGDVAAHKHQPRRDVVRVSYEGGLD